ncbi:MAG: fibronectin type III domain-containing protein, partial [Patescibacteria group bacterium]
TLEIADLIAPEDITNFLAEALNETTAELNWTASIDTAGDLAHYLIYKSGDAGVTYSAALEVAESLTSFNYDGLTPGATYTFKVTAMDENGNESEGVLTTVTLPETGPGMVALAGLSLLGAGVARRKFKKNDLE